MTNQDDPTLAIGPGTLPPEADVSERLPRQIGRYVVLSKLGAGGGGVVFSAYDPELHRRVAVKVLRSGGGSEGSGRERLLREAQAIAQLSHPNVISIHDVGVIEASQDEPGLARRSVYIVMELAAGPTLKEWLGTASHPWREVVETLIAAGRGLAAAHAQGLVHRDFKPANVLVGDDGRVRVLDFGLARSVGEGVSRADPSFDSVDAGAASPSHSDCTLASNPEAPASHLLDSELTGAGNVVGTPAYMAPEQHRGMEADARTDQYGFCVTLYEALAGHKPFQGKTAQALLELKLAGPPRLESSEVTRSVHGVIERGLSPSPNDRFPDMDALLERLSYDPARRWRRRLVVFGLGGAAVLASAVAVHGWRKAQSACVGARQHLEGVWDQEIRSRARDAFASSSLAYAEDAWHKVDQALAEHTDAWVVERESACRAGLVDGSRSTREMAARMVCLDRALDRLAEVSELLRHADDDVVRNSFTMVRRLDLPRSCREAAREDDRPAGLSSEQRAELDALDRKLDRADVLVESGKYGEADPLAAEVSRAARQVEDWRLASKAEQLRCRIALSNDRHREGMLLCRQSLEAAERSGHPRMPIGALARWAHALNTGSNREVARALVEVAVLRFEALPTEHQTARLEAYLADSEGNIHFDLDEYAEAEEDLARGLRLREGYLGAEHPDLLPSLNGLALVAQNRGDHGLALQRYERALAIAEEAYGSMHPIVAALLNNKGGLFLDQEDYETALAVLQRALEIKKATLPRDSPRLLTSTRRVGSALRGLGRLDEAMPYFWEALRLHAKGSGESAPETLESRLPLARALRESGDPTAALDELDRAAEIVRNDPGDVGEFRLLVPLERGYALRAVGDADGAARAFEDAAKVASSIPPSDEAVTALIELAWLRARRGEAEAAKDAFEAARRLGQQVDLDDETRRRLERGLASP